MNILTKTVSILAAAVLLLTASGCGSAEKKPEKSTAASTTANNGKVTQEITLAPEEEDDTDAEAIEYLKTTAPLFSKYLEKRRTVPLTFETEITYEDGTSASAGIYIRDDHTIALSAVDKEGNETRMVYKDKMLYEVNDKDKAVYYGDYSTKKAAKVVQDNLMRLKLNDVRSTYYNYSVDFFEGKQYNIESIRYATAYTATDYYYDMSTDELCYIVNDGVVNKVVALKNEVKESAFELPKEYELVDYNALLNSMLDSNKNAFANVEN